MRKPNHLLLSGILLGCLSVASWSVLAQKQPTKSTASTSTYRDATGQVRPLPPGMKPPPPAGWKSTPVKPPPPAGWKSSPPPRTSTTPKPATAVSTPQKSAGQVQKPTTGMKTLSSPKSYGSTTGLGKDKTKVSSKQQSKLTPESLSKSGFDRDRTKKAALEWDKAEKLLHSSARTYPTGNCAQVVFAALKAGGMQISRGNLHAKDLGPVLRNSGWGAVDTRNYVPRKGDIVILQPYQGGPTTGHIAMYDGKAWYSDFKQKNMYGGSGYERGGAHYDVYRPPLILKN